MLLMFLSLSVEAEKRVELYGIKQLVLDQSPALRQQATSKGLETVLVRVSGSEQTLQHPLVKNALSQSTSYLNQYSYSSSDETITIAGERRPATQLLLQYSPAAIQQLLQSAQLRTWPENRPEILLWVASDKRGKQFLKNESDEMQSIKAAGDHRGLPLVKPLLDLTDRQQLSPARVWAFDENAIREASTRYGADGVMAGRLSVVSKNRWKGSFILLHKGQRTYLNSQGATAQLVAQQLIDQAANYFTGLDAIVLNDKQTAPSMTIEVNNIIDFDRYAGLIAYLTDLPMIAGATVNRVDGGQVILQLRYNGSIDKLVATLADSTVLDQNITNAAATAPAVAATFVWRAEATQ
jgi:hypothetical protein